MSRGWNRHLREHSGHVKMNDEGGMGKQAAVGVFCSLYIFFRRKIKPCVITRYNALYRQERRGWRERDCRMLRGGRKC